MIPKPKDEDPISCKWIYKVKRKLDRRVYRYKAMLVARGFSQEYVQDYEETFIPIAKMTSIRIILTWQPAMGRNCGSLM